MHRRGKATHSVPSGSLKIDENQESLHFRLCHLCFHLNESSTEVDKCLRCHASFKPDVDTAEEIELDGTSDQELEAEEEDLDEIGLPYSSFRRKSPRLAGLTVVW